MELVMKNREWKSLVMGDLVARTPIIQGGMGIGISLSGLASAVANQGGIGVISAAGIGMNEKDFGFRYIEANVRALKNEIRKAREMTKGILGVNVMVAMTNFEEMVKAAIEEGIDVIFAGAGLPLSLPHMLGKSDRTKLVPIVSSGRAARVIAKRWLDKYAYTPDAVVVEGPMAGGHLGFSDDQICREELALENIVTDVISELASFSEKSSKSIPVIAAGGIYTGADIHRFLALGASGVQLGTRFVATDECDASLAFKEAYVAAEKKDIGIIRSPVGLPGRAIINTFLEEIAGGIKKPFSCPFHCIHTCESKSSPYCITLALINAKLGKFRNGFAFAGANAYRVDRIQSVRELIETLRQEYSGSCSKVALDNCME